MFEYVTDPPMFDPGGTDAEGNPISAEALHASITLGAGQIAAATYRWLAAVGELDRRGIWASWECRSAAHFISWQCGVDLFAAKEQVKVAARLRELPAVSAAFCRGELSYFQVRALTRVATPETEEDLANFARYATCAQLDRLTRAYRRVLETQAEDRGEELCDGRHVGWFFDEDGFFVLRARLSPEEGKVVQAALEALTDQLRAVHKRAQAGPGRGRVVPGGAPDPTRPGRPDALVAIAETALATGPAARRSGDRHQVILHVDAASLAGYPGSHCELEGGPSIPSETARRLSCDASVVSLIEDEDGNPLYVGRKTRNIPPALRRALRARDSGCRFPGCGQGRFVEGHHARHWTKGGETSIDNLLELCWWHHRAVHEGGYRLEGDPKQGFRFRRPNGEMIEASRPYHGPHDGDLARDNERAGIEVGPETCVTRWRGEKMNLSYAVEVLIQGDERLPGPT